ncbi:glyoxalase [Streptococcus sp.]|uniref:glyoxalase n=1 Tax=Streptococcus sp. TaxID=1306 RepID=UPI0035A12B28
MFSKNLGVMLYVDDVAAEKVFWEAVGFDIVAESEVMGFETFDMKSHADSTATFTVYAKEFIRQVSPQVIDMQPSVLFETEDIEGLHARVAAETDTVSAIQDQPFKNFNFASPSGQYYAVKGN